MIALTTCTCNDSGVKFHQLCIFINISPLILHNLWITMTTCYPLHPCQCLIPSASPKGWYMYLASPVPLNLKVYTEKGLFSKHCWLNITYMYMYNWYTPLSLIFYPGENIVTIEIHVLLSLSWLLNVVQMHIVLAPNGARGLNTNYYTYTKLHLS